MGAGLAEYERLCTLVQEVNACELPGCTIKYGPFNNSMWRAVERGFVTHDNATFCAGILRYGATCGIQVDQLRGQRIFRNYSSALEARAPVMAEINKRVSAGKTLQLGAWGTAAMQQLRAYFADFIVFPLGAVAKYMDGVLLPTKRLIDDHTRTGLNDSTDMTGLWHSLHADAAVAWYLKQGYVLRVSDVDSAYPLLPLYPGVWPFFMFAFWESDAATVQSLFMHVCGDFGTRGMPGTFKIFFDVLQQMARSDMVLTLPMAVHVDDCALVGPCKEQTDSEMERFQAWSGDTCGVYFKAAKDKLAAQQNLYIGFVWDSITLTRTLEENKLASYIELLRDYAGRTTLSLSELQSVAGKVHRAVKTLPPGASCLMANMFAMTHGLKLPWHRRRTTAALRQDFTTVADFLELNMGRGYYSYSLFDTAPEVLSDASKSKNYTGGGYVSADGRYSYWRYGTSAARKPIDFLEGDTVVGAVDELSSTWGKCLVPFGVDNQAFQKSADKGWSHAARLQDLVMQLFTRQIKGEFILQFFWLSSEANVLADHLSRDRESEFLRVCATMGYWAEGVLASRHSNAGHVRHIGKAFADCTDGDGPGLGKGLLQMLSVSYPRATLDYDLPEEYADRLDEIRDHRLRPSSMRTVMWAKEKWLAVAARFNFPRVIKSDDIRRGSYLAVFVMVLLDDTELVYSSIASCMWGLRVWLSLQHQADPIMGVMGWADFMAAVRVLSWVPAEPRRAVPLEHLRAALESVDLNSFWEVQCAHFIVSLLFTFSRSECPCPKNFTGEESFDADFHWQVADIGVRTVNGRAAMGYRFKGNKSDGLRMRSEARGDGDWVYVGDVRDSVFSIFLWHRRLMAFHGRKRPDAQPFYLDKDQRRPYTYSCGLNDFRSLLGRVSGCVPKDYGLHSLRVTGYNLAKQSVGEELTVAHGGWKSSAHSRYGRFEFMLGKVLAMPAAMVGAPPPEEQAPEPREIRRGAGGARRQSARGGTLDQWVSYSDDDEEEAQVNSDSEIDDDHDQLSGYSGSSSPVSAVPASAPQAVAGSSSLPPGCHFVPLAASPVPMRRD